MSEQPTSPAPAPLELPFDPWRLLHGVFERRRWFLAGAAAGLLLALGYGMLRASTRYEVTVQLMRRDVPTTLRTAESGEPFRPRQLSAATLSAVASSTNVLRRVAAKAEPRLSLSLLRQSTEVREQRGTDYVALTLSGYASVQATVDLANLWAAEVVDFTREMQARESAETRQYLELQLGHTERELEDVRTRILEYSKREGIVAVDKQIDASLRELGELDLRLTTSRLERDAADARLTTLRQEIRRVASTTGPLATARQELATARARFTDENPIVQEKLAHVRQLEAAPTDPDESDLSSHTGSFLGDTLYLQIVELENRCAALRRETEQLTELRTASAARLEELPRKEMGLAQLTLARSSLESARALLFGRLREAQLFEERAPGYYQVFAAATPDAVGTRSRTIKVLVFSVLGLVFGCGGAFAAALAAELLDPRLRTASELARVFGTRLLADLDRSCALAPDTASHIWMSWLGREYDANRVHPVIVPVPGQPEDAFWAGLLQEASHLLPDLLVVTVGDCALPAPLAALPAEGSGAGPHLRQLETASISLDAARRLNTALMDLAASGRPVWLRLAGPVCEPLTTLARGHAAPLIVALIGSTTAKTWREQAEHVRTGIGIPLGVVAAQAQTP